MFPWKPTPYPLLRPLCFMLPWQWTPDPLFMYPWNKPDPFLWFFRVVFKKKRHQQKRCSSELNSLLSLVHCLGSRHAVCSTYPSLRRSSHTPGLNAGVGWHPPIASSRSYVNTNKEFSSGTCDAIKSLYRQIFCTRCAAWFPHISSFTYSLF